MTKLMLLRVKFRVPDFKKTALFILFVAASHQSFIGQNSLVVTDQLKIQSDSILKTVTIDFNTPNEIANLLVRIDDSEGHTIFLDNKYNFSGIYKKIIDLKKQEKGTYSIEVTKDSKSVHRKIEMR